MLLVASAASRGNSMRVFGVEEFDLKAASLFKDVNVLVMSSKYT